VVVRVVRMLAVAVVAAQNCLPRKQKGLL